MTRIEDTEISKYQTSSVPAVILLWKGLGDIDKHFVWSLTGDSLVLYCASEPSRPSRIQYLIAVQVYSTKRFASHRSPYLLLRNI
jgi:hypothetical protein